MREEANIARWVEVTPTIFEATIAEEMEKYERFKDDTEAGAMKQEELLEHIKVSDCSLSMNDFSTDERFLDPK